MNMNIFEQSKHKTTTKTGMVLEHLQKEGSITSWDAIKLYRATRLSAIIFNLRDEGYDILSENCNSKESGGDGKTHWVNYIYKGMKGEPKHYCSLGGKQ